MTIFNKMAWVRRTVPMLFFLAIGLSLMAQTINKFADPVIRRIYDLADQRDADGLLYYLQDSNMNYRGEALLCMGSVQPVGMADTLYHAMQTNADGVRMMGAFALGQTRHPDAVPYIREALKNERNELVRGMLFEALGKCGDEAQLNWMARQKVKFQESEGYLAGILRFGIRRITSLSGNAQLVKLMFTGSSRTGMIFGSYYLGRYAGMDWLQLHPDSVLALYEKERDPEVRANLIKAVIRAMDEKAWVMVSHLLDSDVDYRIKVNCLHSMSLLPWNKALKQVLKLAEGENPNVSVAAAEAVQKNGVYTDLPVLLKSIKKTTNWRSRSLLLQKALDLVYGKAGLVKKVEKMIFESLANTTRPVEQAWYLKCLTPDPLQYTRVAQALKRAAGPVVATAALETLIAMQKSSHFATAAEKMNKQGVDLKAEFSKIYRKAIQSGDLALVTLASAQLKKPFKTPPVDHHPIDWERVIQIPPRQQVAVVTNKGEFVIRLNVNWCPATVSAFLELAETGFYNNGMIHRVVPDFVVQDGCPRGDGWGGPDFTIRSEFSPVPFLAGALGMASSGKDTEGSQWYVTHSATPHLDGSYTNFGTVVSGMEVVNRLEVGDRIERIELLQE